MAEGVRIRRRLEFSSVPGTTALFRDYLSSFSRVMEFYPADPRRLMEELDPDRVLGGRNFSRQRVAEILQVQNQKLGCGPQTLAHIQLLKCPDTLVVITGQQVGLFTGPLFAIYKASTVLQLTRQLSQRFPFQFIPLFWMASDDHDYAEVDHVAILDQTNRLVTLQHPGNHSPGLPVGPLELGPEIEPLLTKLDQTLPRSEFKAQVMELVKAAYRPTATFAEAFGRAMLSLFAQDGLVLVDPAEPELRRLAEPVFQTELKNAPRSTEVVAERGAQLVERGYHAQIRTASQAVNLFLLVDGRRVALIKENQGFRLKKGQQTFSLDELVDLLEKSPERFSPNVVLRPVVQDHLFPVAAYVAGPAEIAYYAQLGEVYKLFGIPRPVIYPRASFTLMEGRVGGLLEKFGLGIEDVFVEEGHLVGRVMKGQMPGELDELFKVGGQQIRETFQALSEKVIAFEPTLQGYLDSSAGKVEHQLKAVRRKLFQARRAREALLREQVSKVSRHLFPAGQLQERVLNITPFLARHGPRIIADLEPASCEPWEHQVVEIGR